MSSVALSTATSSGPRLRADLTIVSLDWGFNEQLILLTDAPTLCEPIWGPRAGEKPPPPDSANVIYLLHPPEYALYSEYNNPRLDAAIAGAAAGRLELRPYRDRQNRVAFYTVRRLPHPDGRDSATSAR